MREEYFNSNNIKQTSNIIRQYLESIINLRSRTFNPISSALLILDMQNYFLSQNSHAYIPSSKAILNNINSLIEKFDSCHLPIIFTKHLNDDNNAGMMKNWWKEMITSENKYCDISDSVKYSGHKIINKSQYDAFYNTELEDYLKERHVKQLIVTGVMTHLCCETTIRSSFVRNYEVFFPIDATADYNLDFHQASFLNLSHGFCTPIFTEEIFKMMDGI